MREIHNAGWAFTGDNSGYFVEDADCNTVAIFETNEDANAYVKMETDLDAAMRRAEAAEARAATWIPIAERLPDTMLRVLAVYVKDSVTTTIRALHIAAHEAICWGYDFDEAIYDAEEDKYYYPEGWYEAMEDGEFAFVGPMQGMVTHWAQLPALPARE